MRGRFFADLPRTTWALIDGSRDRFSERPVQRPVMLGPPPITRLLNTWRDPADAYRALAASAPYAVWKDAGIGEAVGTSFIGLPSDGGAFVLLNADDEVEEYEFLDGTPARIPSASTRVGLVGFVESLRQRLLGSNSSTSSLGWWGWLGYEAGSIELGVPAAIPATPNAAFLFADRGIEFDHAARSVRLVSLTDSAETRRWFDATEQALSDERFEHSVAPEPPRSALSSSWRHDQSRYLAMIAECQASITRGDAYQICLTNMIDIDLDPTADPLEIYLRMRAISPTSHGGLVRLGPWALLSGSPEQFLTVDTAGRAVTRPIKGTRRRGIDRDEDDALIAELLASDKERAENLMIVDLMRNDLSRTSQVGSVEVSQFFAVESYPNVHQLVSTVESDLIIDGLAATVALFPAGSMTGAPKISAMTILAQLEEGPRGVYAGVWGCFSADGSVDLAVVIRSIVMWPGHASIGTGGGITALSDPQDEWDEIVLKAGPVLESLGLGLPLAV